MVVIGQGAQFQVTDLGDRVHKQLLTLDESAEVFAGWQRDPFAGEAQAELAAAQVLNTARASLRGLHTILAAHPEISASMGHPEIIDDSSYTQDKVTPLGIQLRRVSSATGRILLDGFASLQLDHAAAGFADTTFNVTGNAGVNSEGKVIMIDIGELTFDRDSAAAQAANRQWLRAYPFWSPRIMSADALPFSLRPYYQMRMRQTITSEAIRANWPDEL